MCKSRPIHTVSGSVAVDTNIAKRLLAILTGSSNSIDGHGVLFLVCSSKVNMFVSPARYSGGLFLCECSTEVIPVCLSLLTEKHNYVLVVNWHKELESGKQLEDLLRSIAKSHFLFNVCIEFDSPNVDTSCLAILLVNLKTLSFPIAVNFPRTSSDCFPFKIKAFWEVLEDYRVIQPEVACSEFRRKRQLQS